MDALTSAASGLLKTLEDVLWPRDPATRPTTPKAGKSARSAIESNEFLADILSKEGLLNAVKDFQRDASSFVRAVRSLGLPGQFLLSHITLRRTIAISFSCLVDRLVGAVHRGPGCIPYLLLPLDLGDSKGYQRNHVQPRDPRLVFETFFM